MGKIFKYIYYKLVPQFVRIKFYKLELIISYYFNPLSKAKINRFAVEESFQACKKELSENDINSKNTICTERLTSIKLEAK